MKRCKTCGTPGKLIQVNRELTANQEALKALIKDLRQERTQLRKQVRQLTRKVEKAQEATAKARDDLGRNKATMTLIKRETMRLEQKLKNVEWDNVVKSGKVQKMEEKLKHIYKVASKPNEWLNRND